MSKQEIEKILSAHQNWLTTEGKEGKRADFSGAILWRTDLRGANLCHADLSKADLYGALLYEADLRGADLRGADLSHADLRKAYLYGADLRKADLRGVDLRKADLREADLYGADLRVADLRGANFRKAYLRKADLCHAELSGADFSGADLRGADLDYSCLPLWCGGKFKADARICKQLIAHTLVILELSGEGDIELLKNMREYKAGWHRENELIGK